jgi:hypothetical protein
MTGHCPHCGEPVMLVPISTLVASERQARSCDVQPEPAGPVDHLPERQPSPVPTRQPRTRRMTPATA